MLVTAIAAAAMVVPRERTKAMLWICAIVLSPALLVYDLSDSPQLSIMHRSPLVAVAAGVVGIAVLVALSLVLKGNAKVFPYLVAVALPFRLPIAVGGETANLLLPLYLVIGAGTLAWATPLITRKIEDPDRRPTLLDWAIAAWLVLFGLAAVWSGDPSKAVQQAVFFYVPFSLLFQLASRVEWNAEIVRGCALILVGLALVFSGIAFFEYGTKTLLLNPKLLISNQFHTYFRVNSVFFDPNIFGRYLMLVMIGLAASLLDTKRGKNVAAICACLAVLLTAMVMTLSQSSFLGLLVGLAVIAALRWTPWKIGVVALLIASVGVAAVVVSPSSSGLKLHSLKVLNSESSGRTGLVGGGIDLFKEKPVFGWGAGDFSKAYRAQQGAGAPAAVSASHTTPVTVAAEQGIVGLAVYLLLLVAVLLRALQGARMSTARTAVVAGLAALVVHSFFYAAFFEDPITWVLFALAVALPIPLTIEERRAEREAKRAERNQGTDADAVPAT